MGYLQDSLINALGMQKIYKQDRSSVVSDWTPNGVKSIIIGKNYILVAKHLGVSTGCVKRYDLDVNLVAEDLQKMTSGYGKAKLNSVLMKRSLTCLEEIYIDTMYLSYPTVINLVEYVQEMMKSTSRLRYFGYGNLPESGLDAYLNKAYIENSKNLDYTIGTDENISKALNVRSTGNDKWYTKYMLRPTYYKLDNDKGNLAIHFRKFESDYTRYLENKDSLEKANSYERELSMVIDCDIEKLQILSRVDSMLGKMFKNSNDAISKLAVDVWKRVILSSKPVSGLTVIQVERVCSNGYIKSYYDKYQVLDKSGNTCNVDLGKYTEGFLDINSVLDEFCLKLCEGVMREHGKEVVGVALMVNEGVIPEGKFRSTYLRSDSDDGASIGGYFSFIGDVVGYQV